MLELIAQGNELGHRWRRALPKEVEVRLGRSTAPWSVHWDSSISRQHLSLNSDGEQVRVTQLDSATNPIFFKGSAASRFLLQPGEHFVVGTTTFFLVDSKAFATQDLPDPIRQQTFRHEDLRRLPYIDANRRMEVLNQLPAVIASAGNNETLLSQFLSLLLRGIAHSTTVGVVVAEASQIQILHWDSQANEVDAFQPSEGLIRSA